MNLLGSDVNGLWFRMAGSDMLDLKDFGVENHFNV